MHSIETPEPAKANGTPSVTRLGADETKRTFPPRRRLGDEQELEVTRLYVETTLPVAQIGQQFGIGESSVYRIAQRNGASLRGRTPSSTLSAASSETVTPPAAPAAVALAAPVADGVAQATATPVAASGAPAATPTRTRAKRASRVPRVVHETAPAAAVAPATPPPASPEPVPAARTRRRRTPAATSPAPAVTATRRRRTRAATSPAATSTPVAATPVVSVAMLRFRIRFFAEMVVEAVDLRAALRQAEALGATEVSAITRQG